MSNQCYSEEIKVQTINQLTEKQFHVSEVAARLGGRAHPLYLD